jgi:hypothetical protein
VALPTRRELLELSAATGFTAASLEKVLRLADLLEAISDRPLLEAALVLKGGTALNLFFSRPTRLSVDLDFNYVGAVDRDEMLRERPAVEAEMERVVRSRGYVLQQSAEAFAGRKLFLSFRRLGDTLPDRIEIDVNFLHRQRWLDATHRPMWMPGSETEGPRFPVQSFDELAAGKLIALLDRTAPRDAWDVARLPELSGGTWPGARGRGIFIAMAGMLPRPLFSYSRDRIDRLRDSDVRRLLHPMLIETEKPSAAELRRAAGAVIGPLLELSEEEREFCERLERGELAPELLFPDDADLTRRIAASPPLRWKARHAASRQTRERE